MSGSHCRRAIRARCGLWLAIAACGLAGCSETTSGPDRFDVSGTVTYDGAPVPAGQIQFRPDSAKGHSGPAGFATITNGRYDTSRKGRGTVGGPHVVVIVGFTGPPPTDVQSDEDLADNSLFSEYQISADLPTETGQLDFDVPAGED